MPHVRTVDEELEWAQAELIQAKDRLRHALSVDEAIACRIEIGECSQRIRRLRMEQAGRRLV